MTIHKEAAGCRVCSGALESVLDLGVQRLGGQFPKIGDPDPPAAPLHLMRCADCGLAQLGHTVSPELMFRSYGYSSGISATMRAHLKQLADEAWRMLPERRLDLRVLDVGANDNTLLSYLDAERFAIDPSDVPLVYTDDVRRKTGFFPQDMPPEWKNFDLIFTVACFYDADDPVDFAKAVADRLAPDGLWCVEVADAARMVREGGWDAICHEHLCYYEPWAFQEVCLRAGLVVVDHKRNDCNGGSDRYYVRKAIRSEPRWGVPLARGEWADFAVRVQRSRDEIAEFLSKDYGSVHLLGASTKANTWLQAAGAYTSFIVAASDRDPRKVGRRTPGTGIPIISEEDSRQLRPDVYLVGPWHFADEITKRERAFLERGGRLVFPLPKLHEVKA